MAKLLLRLTDQHIWRQSHVLSLSLLRRCNLGRCSMPMLVHQVQCLCDDSNNSSPSNTIGPKPLEGHRETFIGRRRQLSPLQRVDQLIADSEDQEKIDEGNSAEHDSNGEDGDNIHDGNHVADRCGEVENSSGQHQFDRDHNVHIDTEKETVENPSFSHRPFVDDRPKSGLGPGRNALFVDGEIVFVVMENVKKNVSLKKMFVLQAGEVFHCQYGRLEHTDIVGHHAGKVLLTDQDVPLLVRRASLEEYVLHVRRMATISYPKDIAAMLMLIDISPGDVILEAGTGSGAMSLHLSRAVWTGGTVHTYENNAKHQKVAKRNIRVWRNSYNLSHEGDPWPENICFYSWSLQDSDMDSDSVDGAILDLEEPHHMLPAIADKLKRGRAAAIYVSNLSQVIDITDVVRIKQLPLSVEDVIDVTHQHWLVHPARRRRETAPLDRVRVLRGQDVSIEESNHHSVPGDKEAYIIGNVPKYITRPKHKQPSFSAFLVKVRKIISSDLKHKK